MIKVQKTPKGSNRKIYFKVVLKSRKEDVNKILTAGGEKNH